MGEHIEPVPRIADVSVRPKKCYSKSGVLFDSEMSMLPHINHVFKTYHSDLQTISRIRVNLREEACAVAVRALVSPRLDYGN